MITRPTEFLNHHQRSGSVGNFIVHLTHSTNNWYLSETDMQLGTDHIYPLLLNSPTFREGVDIFTKTWYVSEVRLTFSNLPYKKNSSGVWVRLSDEIGWVRNTVAKIYLASGNGVTALSDCLLKFNGYVKEPPEYDHETIKITLVDKLFLKDKEIPETTVGSIYTTAPSDYFDKLIPLVYGKFTLAGSDTTNFDYTGNGLAIAIPTELKFPPTCVISDHILNAATAIYLKEKNIDDPVICDSASFNVNESGRGTADPSLNGIAYVYVSDNEDTGYPTASLVEPVDAEKAYDRDDTTYANLLDTGDNGTALDAMCTYRFKNGAEIRNMIPNSLTSYTIQAKLWKDAAFATTVTARMLGQDDTSAYSTIYATSTWQDSATPITKSDVGTKNFNAIGLRIECTVWSPADGVAGNYTAGVLKIYGLRLKIKYQVLTYQGKLVDNVIVVGKPRHMGTAGWGQGQDIDYAQFLILSPIFVACEGREYGSWITSRSSNYASGDCIEDPAGIIESLLREQLIAAGSLSADDLDLPSFIAAENTNVKMRMNLHSGNKQSIFTLIKQICEQSTFSFHMSGSGKCRLIPLNDYTVTTAATIHFSQVLGGEIIISKNNSIINNLQVESRLQQEYNGIYRDLDTYENSTSQTAYGEYGYKGKWPNICGTSAQHVARHLVKKLDGTDSNDDGLWANEHLTIEFETMGFAFAHLEPGDWIELDGTSFDAQVKAYGSSWADEQFLVVDVQQSLTTKIKAIKLFDQV